MVPVTLASFSVAEPVKSPDIIGASFNPAIVNAVSYTHLTLPTKRIV